MVKVRGMQAEFRFYRPGAKRVELVGDFTSWRTGELVMQPQDDGYWTASLRLTPGTYRFRYYADGSWFCDYAAFGLENGQFGMNSILQIASSQQTYSTGRATAGQRPAA